MAEKINQTPPSVSNEAVMEMFKSMSDSMKKLNDSIVKGQRDTEFLIKEVLQIRAATYDAKLFPSGTLEVTGHSEGNNLARGDFATTRVSRQLAPELVNESTGLGADESSPSAEDDEQYQRPTQDARRQPRVPTLGARRVHDGAPVVKGGEDRRAEQAPFSRLRHSILKNEPSRLEIEPPSYLNYVPPETNSSQVADANFSKEAEARKLSKLTHPLSFVNCHRFVVQHDRIRLRDPEAHARNWTKFVTPEAMEDILSFNSERVVIDGVRYPSYFGHLEQYVGRAGLIHCLNADNNEYKTHSSYDESLAVPSTNPDELMLLDYSAMRVIVLGIAARRPRKHIKMQCSS